MGRLLATGPYHQDRLCMGLCAALRCVVMLPGISPHARSFFIDLTPVWASCSPTPHLTLTFPVSLRTTVYPSTRLFSQCNPPTTASQALCVRLAAEHEEAAKQAEAEFEELKAFLTAHNEAQLEEARKRYQEAVAEAQVRRCASN